MTGVRSLGSRVAALLPFVFATALLAGCSGTPGAPPSRPTPTLRALYSLSPPTRWQASKTALVLVDFQDEFFHGRLPVEGGDDAVTHAAALRRWARGHGILVVHVRNVVLPKAGKSSPIFAEGSPTLAIVPALEPEEGELLVTKHLAGAFSKTELDGLLRARGIDTVIAAGIMTHLAVDTTARDAAVLGYHVVVAADACATRALPAPQGGVIEAAVLHRVALASLADRFADVMTTAEIEALPAEP